MALNEDDKKNLKGWFSEQALWIQKAAKIIIEKKELEDSDYDELIKDCTQEAKDKILKEEGLPQEFKNKLLQEVKKDCHQEKIEIPLDSFVSSKTSDSIKLTSIEDVQNIDALAPRNPLKFKENLSVIYGLNASGKSGYTRILQHACKKDQNLELKPNVFENFENQNYCIKYKKNENEETARMHDVEKNLNNIDIFDSNYSRYLEKKESLTYEPPILNLFSDIAKVCQEVKDRIKSKINERLTNKPIFLNQHKTEPQPQTSLALLQENEDLEKPKDEKINLAKWYNNLSYKTTIEEIDAACKFIDNNQKELNEIETRLKQKDPAQEAKKIEDNIKDIQDFFTKTDNLKSKFSDNEFKKITKLKRDYLDAKKTSHEKSLWFNKDKDLLKGVGTETWKKLWEHAKSYSEQQAYKNQTFPVISDDAKCVLCHQELDEKSKNRFKTLKDFIDEEFKKDEEEKKNLLTEAKNNLPAVINSDRLITELKAMRLEEENNKLIESLYFALEKRKKLIIDYINADIDFNDEEAKTKKENEITQITIPSIEEWKNKIKSKNEEQEKQVKQYNEDAKENNKEGLLEKQKMLKRKKWFSENIQAIKKEVQRLQDVKIFEKAQESTNTTGITTKKKKLSDKLSIENFTKRFQDELKELKADYIKVEISKPTGTGGQVKLEIKLKGSVHNAAKILSEGERRIILLAAFLADVTGNDNKTPFIFDDPISSLDIEFEEAVCKRLIEISRKRQVIVFTHRLSLQSLLVINSKDENLECNNLIIEQEPWGTGELRKEIPVIDKLIKKLKEVQRRYNKEGNDYCRSNVTCLASNFRVVVEDAIESTLLQKVIIRFNPKITSSKIKKLSKISVNDCVLLDKLMTRYSKYVHPQSVEIAKIHPSQLLKEIEKDFDDFKNWKTEFKKKTKRC